jgi:hypothetical protein
MSGKIQELIDQRVKLIKTPAPSSTNAKPTTAD